MEIRHQHGTAETVWKLDMFYMFEPKTKRCRITREIEDYTLSLDGTAEVPDITYDVELQEKANPEDPDVILRRFAMLTFSSPRSGTVVAQLREIE